MITGVYIAVKNPILDTRSQSDPTGRQERIGMGFVHTQYTRDELFWDCAMLERITTFQYKH